MKRCLALFLALIMVLSLAACGSKGPGIADAAGKRNKLPAQQEAPAKTETDEGPEQPQPQTPAQEKPAEKPQEPAQAPEVPAEDPEPSQGLDAYDCPPDHPHEGKKLTVYDGIYKATLPQGDDEETWVEITGYPDFILLEYHGLMEGSVYRYWVEEFWPGEGWYTDTATDTVSGKSQIFSSMAQYENYSGLPQNRCITLTDDGVVLNCNDSDAEYYVREDGFEGGHADPAEMRERLGEDVHLDFGFQYDAADVVGTWGMWTGWEAACMTFGRDGTFSLYWKTPNEPIRVYEGVYGFGTYSGNLVIAAERLGYGGYPYWVNWQWVVGETGDLMVSDEEGTLFEGEYFFFPVEETFFTVMDGDTALGYILEQVQESGEYTDTYGSEYYYYYSLPQFYHSEHRDLERINRRISEVYLPIIEMELQAMEAGDLLSYDHVDWQSGVYAGILFLHVYAYTFDWEEHDAFYIDLETMEQLDGAQVLQRLGIDEQVFLDAVRTKAEGLFVSQFSGIPEEEREEYGYYRCLEKTLSDAFVNPELPIFMDRSGRMTVYIKLSSMAGSGLIWVPSDLFAATEAEEAVG